MSSHHLKCWPDISEDSFKPVEKPSGSFDNKERSSLDLFKYEESSLWIFFFMLCAWHALRSFLVKSQNTTILKIWTYIFWLEEWLFTIFLSKYTFLCSVFYFMSIPLLLMSVYLILWEDFFNCIRLNVIHWITNWYFVYSYLLNAKILSIQMCYEQKLII